MSKDYVAGEERDQSILFPETLDEYIAEENPVRFIDAFVDSLDLDKLGLTHAKLDGGAGRPPYDPSDLLKLYVYGYLNQIRTSRKLEKACVSNLEVMWLMKKLAPDFKTIADFRKENVDCVKKVFKEFVFICKSLDLFGAELVAVDGSKFKAVNSRGKNFSLKGLKERLKRIEEKIESYLKEMEGADREEARALSSSSSASQVGRDGDDKGKEKEPQTRASLLAERLEKLGQRKDEYAILLKRMEETGKKEISLTDPDSRLMRVGGRQLDVCYNVQSAIDSKHHLVAHYDVTNSASDYGQLSDMAKGAREVLLSSSGDDCDDGATLDVTADTGYYSGREIKECVEHGIVPYVPARPPRPSNKGGKGVPKPGFWHNKFTYDRESDTYTCPADHQMSFWTWDKSSYGERRRLYRTAECKRCPFRAECTTNRQGRIIYRWEHEAILDEMKERLKTAQGMKAVRLRMEMAEHPFGTMKRAFNQGYLLLRGLRKVSGEVGFTMLAYNMRRAINVVGTKKLMASLG